MRIRLAPSVAALSLALLAAGCGPSRATAPLPVPTNLVPRSVLAGTLRFYLNTDPSTVAAFTQTGRNSLISAGDLWEIRRGARLVGTLEIATVKPSINLAKSKVRDQFTSPILVGATSDIRLVGQEVSTVDNPDGVATLVWFGQGLFEVLQSEDNSAGPGPELAQAIIAYERTQSAWRPLPQLYSP